MMRTFISSASPLQACGYWTQKSNSPTQHPNSEEYGRGGEGRGEAGVHACVPHQSVIRSTVFARPNLFHKSKQINAQWCRRWSSSLHVPRDYCMLTASVMSSSDCMEPWMKNMVYRLCIWIGRSEVGIGNGHRRSGDGHRRWASEDRRLASEDRRWATEDLRWASNDQRCASEVGIGGGHRKIGGGHRKIGGGHRRRHRRIGRLEVGIGGSEVGIGKTRFFVRLPEWLHQ